jgi:hypothetical protein
MNHSPLARTLVIALMLAALSPAAIAQSGQRSVEQLQRDLAARDAAISDLQRRVQALESKLGASAAGAPPAQAPAVAAGLPQPTNAAEETIDDELLARALERSLVLSGGVVLARGQREFEPSLQYDYLRRSGLAIIGSAVASQDVRRDNYTAGFGMRAGLPWNSQVELSVPLRYQTIEGITAGESRIASDSGLGDLRVGFSKHLLNETSGRPGLVGNLSWQFSNGNSNLATLAHPPSGVVPPPSTALGSGYDALSASITAIKRADPLVFLGSLSHSINFSTTAGGARFNPSDTTSASFRTILATSPNVSLRAGFLLARTGSTALDGTTIPGSKQTLALLELGGSMVLSRQTLLDVSVEAGLTQDSPDFVLGLSLPVRF